MRARRLPPPAGARRRSSPGARPAPSTEAVPTTTAAGQGRWRDAGRRATRDPRGHPVLWWHRPPPRGDRALWQAVMRLQAERLRLGLSVTDLARRMEARGTPMRRETISRVLHGKQATTWATAEMLADAVGVVLDRPSWPQAG